MTTPDAIMLTLSRLGPLAMGRLFREAAMLLDDCQLERGLYGDYPQDGFDALACMGILQFIELRDGKYWLTEKGQTFCTGILSKEETES